MTILARLKKDGLEEGVKEVTEKTRRDTARKLLMLGVDLEIVADSTDLSVELVKEIQAELNGDSN